MRGADKALVKACFDKAYELEDHESPVAYSSIARRRKPHWTRKQLISEMTSSHGEWITGKYREPLIRELAKIISAGQSGMYLEQAKMMKKYGKDYSSTFDVSNSGSYVTCFLGITDTPHCNTKAH